MIPKSLVGEKGYGEEIPEGRSGMVQELADAPSVAGR